MKIKKYRILFLALVLAGFIICGWVSADEVGQIRAEATEVKGAEATQADGKVQPVWADYDALWLKVDANGNTKVYYSDKSKKNWYEAKSAKEDGDDKEYYYIDISWLSSTSASVINLKGDVNDEIVSITFPARNSTFKAKYDKAAGEITFENIPDGIQTFEWRKATSYTWNTATIVNGKSGSDIKETIEKLRIAGASIYIRLPQTEGRPQQKTAADGTTTMEFAPGIRQSKEIKINITKLAAAPKVTIDGTKLLLNSKTTMEYSLNNGNSWTDMEAKMPISKIAPVALYYPNGTVNSGSETQSVNVLIRTKQTDKKPASKSFLLTIPAQRQSPAVLEVKPPNSVSSLTDVAYYSDASKFYMNFTKASKEEPYEYLVVKPGTATPDLSKGWKAVTSAKTISLSSKTATAGSIIYIRKKTVKANAKTGTPFKLASAYTAIPVNYDTTATSTPAK